VERGRFAEYRDAGVTRVSLGAQSFDDRCLAALGRIHSRGDTLAAVSELRAAGLDNFNLDLMYALPEQTPDDALADLEQALDLGRRTFRITSSRWSPALRSNDGRRHCRTRTRPSRCRSPASRASRPRGSRSTRFQPTLGRARMQAQPELLAFRRLSRDRRGAHGKLTDPNAGSVTRTARVRQPGRYLAAPSPVARVAETRVLSADDLAFEFCLNALRLVAGFDAELFEARTGLRGPFSLDRWPRRRRAAW